MKKLSYILFSTFVIGTLAACGQGNEDTDNENIGGADEVEENLDEVNEENNLTEENNENNNVEENSDTNEADADNTDNEVSTENNSGNNENNDTENNAADNNAEVIEEDDQVIEDPTDASNNNEEADNESEDANTESNEGEAEAAAGVSPLYLYFSDAELMNTYRVEADTDVPLNEAGAMEAMELWAAGPTSEELYSLLPEGVSVQSVELEDDTAHVSFSSEIQDANLGSSGEGMLTEQVAMMMEQFNAEKTLILIDGETSENFLGHMDLSTPIQAGSPDEYEIFE
ncbi:GerMN domain-containing protein [Alkalicoccus daliensis]|uniref:Sporulation and spore germination n=1 Tax=Alkalicoccus daliensis TaxID=745820 RepID=A0A1H0IN44_9BACI|nr:GerMN domain-containing protein [Alkalicoccus daliensis]SDO32775.1 Sporulation and spore germination [Alkalicoccus daliensis]